MIIDFEWFSSTNQLRLSVVEITKSVCTLKPLFFLISVNIGRIFTSISSFDSLVFFLLNASVGGSVRNLRSLTPTRLPSGRKALQARLNLECG